MDNNLLIIGAGGHGKVVKEIAEAMQCFVKIDFLDDHSDIAIGRLNELEKFNSSYSLAFPAFGNNELRMKWLSKLHKSGFKVPTLIHPSAYVSPSATLKAGTVVEAKAIINTNACVNEGCIIDIGAIVDHDAVIRFGTHIDCGAIVKAYCIVEENTKVESGSVVRKG